MNCIVSSNKPCRNPETCFLDDCGYQHTVDKCLNWKKCSYYFCGLRHAKNRTRPCSTYAKEGSCEKNGCTFLHPAVARVQVKAAETQVASKKVQSICLNAQCLRLLCSSEHPPTSLEIYLKERSLANSDPRQKKLLKSIGIARRSHCWKMTEWLKRYKSVQLKIGQIQEKEENEKVLFALHNEGLELQSQLNYFDKCVYESLMSLNFDAVQFGSISFKSYLVQKIKREIFRLKEALPALSRRLEIENYLKDSQFLVVKGETGSGKSTQLPQYIWEYLSSQNFQHKRVLCTQPRKVSATSLAERVAFEWEAGEKMNTVGQMVGFRVGSLKKVSSKTRIEYCTEGSFLKCLLNIFENQAFDPLKNVGAIVIDEAHERSISCDIILGILKDIAPKKWPNLKIIITSATLNTTLFKNYFYDCPIVEIPGRMYPVDIVYQPIPKINFGIQMEPSTYIPAAVELVYNLHKRLKVPDGDILCFLTGQEEVEKAKELVNRKLDSGSKIAPTAAVLTLYGKQTPEEQALVFQKSPNQRKIVFATDVAETGVTIDGVRHVIDIGLCKESSYDASRNITVLEIGAICQSSATQRAGRAGRTAPGTCYRLYKEEDFESMAQTQTAEVLCKPLSLTFLNLD